MERDLNPRMFYSMLADPEIHCSRDDVDAELSSLENTNSERDPDCGVHICKDYGRIMCIQILSNLGQILC